MCSAAAPRELADDLSPFLKIYTDGTYERLCDTPYVPPVLKDPTTGVSSKDFTDPYQKLPILLHFHAGGFMVGSIFSAVDLKYLNALSSQTKTIIVAVEYRLFPEHRLPAAYDDSESALKWLCSHAREKNQIEKDPWISTHGDFSKIFIHGDSAGANIAYNLSLSIPSIPLPGNLKISGLIITQPFFFGSIPFAGEFEGDVKQNLAYRVWSICYPNVSGGVDSPFLNPLAADDASLSAMGCSKLLVAVAEKDGLTVRAMEYAEKVKKSEFPGNLEIVVSNGEDHCFHVFDPHCENAKILFAKYFAFINS